MKIIHDSLTVRDKKAAGVPTAGGKRRRLARAGAEAESGGGRIIDFEAWKAAHPEAVPRPEGPAEGEAAQRPGRGFLHYALQGAELLATLCVIGVLAALVLRALVV